MSLEEWQSRLESHFRELQERRALLGIELPIFGLEHGLTTEEVESLEREVRADIATRRPRTRHSLAWLVYSCEAGYLYAGEQYWQTFEANTPGWIEYGDRNWLRRAFWRFQSEYGGARPSGRWADQFTIICWPIYHSILPKDLQRQLARTLYRVRHHFSEETFATPLDLGELIKSYSWEANSRFQSLAEEPLLVGQIAAALLLEGTKGFESLIYPDTLQRIRRDLEGEWVARTWLREAKDRAQQLQLKGFSRTVKQAELTSAQTVEKARLQVASLALVPPMFVRAVDSESWDVLLEIPDFRPLLTKFPSFQAILSASRCVIAGSDDRPRARGWLLYGPHTVTLHKWPATHQVLIGVEDAPRELNFLLRTDCLLNPGPVWVFKLNDSGAGRLIQSRAVRPGNRYVLLTRAIIIELAPWITKTNVHCEGINAMTLDVPEVVPTDLKDRLESMGITQMRTLEVWPAGLPPSDWDGEGKGEWLSSDTPRVGILIDHPVDSASVVLPESQEGSFSVAGPVTGEPFFLELTNLEVGWHRLIVTTRRGADEESAHLDIVIREPRDRSTNWSSRGLLNYSIDPINPSLEDIWEGRMILEIDGPSQRTIDWSFVLFDRESQEVGRFLRPDPLRLPADGATWNDKFQTSIKSAHQIQNVYDRAHSCEINFDAEELGTFQIVAHREFTPLRWQFHLGRDGHSLRLLDDSGTDAAPQVQKYEFSTPDKAEELGAEAFLSQLTAVSPGMYVAITETDRRAVIVPPIPARNAGLSNLSQLNVQPKLLPRPNSPGSICDLLGHIVVWEAARQPGGLLVDIYRKQILTCLIEDTVKLLAGRDWLDAEQRFRGEEYSAALIGLKGVAIKASRVQEIVNELSTELDYLCALDPTQRLERFSTLVAKFYKIRTLPAQQESQELTRLVSENALRLASDPAALAHRSGPNLNICIQSLVLNSELVRAARFLVLAVDKKLGTSLIGSGPIYAGWSW